MAKRKRVSPKAANLASTSTAPSRAPRRKTLLGTLAGGNDSHDSNEDALLDQLPATHATHARREGPVLGRDCVDSKAENEEEQKIESTPRLVPRMPPWLIDPICVLFTEEKAKEALEDLKVEEEMKEREHTLRLQDHKTRLLDAQIKDSLTNAAMALNRIDTTKSIITRRLEAASGLGHDVDWNWGSVKRGLEDLGIDLRDEEERKSLCSSDSVDLEKDDYGLTGATYNTLLQLLRSRLQRLCGERSIRIKSSWKKKQLAKALMQWRNEQGAVGASEGMDVAPREEMMAEDLEEEGCVIGRGDMDLSVCAPAPTIGNHLVEQKRPFFQSVRQKAQSSPVSGDSAAAFMPPSTVPKLWPTSTSTATGTVSPEMEEHIAQRVSIAIQSALEKMHLEREAEKAKENRRLLELEWRMEERLRQFDARHRDQLVEYHERESSRLNQQKSHLISQRSKDEARDKVTAEVHRALVILAERVGDVSRDVGVLFGAIGVSSTVAAAVPENAGAEGVSFAAIGRKRRRIAAETAAEEKRSGGENNVRKNILERLEGIEMNILECLEKTKDPEAGLTDPPQMRVQGRENEFGGIPTDVATTSSGSLSMRLPWVGGKWWGGN